MKIELFEEINFDKPESKIINIDVNENLSIGKLLTAIHEITKIPTFTILEWDGNTEKIPSRYYYKSGSEFHEFTSIKDLEQKINEFPKNGSNNILCLLIDNFVGIAN